MTKPFPNNHYASFWTWFQENAPAFHQVVKTGGNIEQDFFNQLAPQLHQVKGGIYFLTGMAGDDTVELVFTPDGIIKNIVFAEELVNAAPAIPGWKFTALKPSIPIEHLRLDMAGYTFDSNTLFFYANDHDEYPDEIDITLVHTAYSEKDKDTILNGVYIFLDNYLGEYHFITTIDNLTLAGKTGDEKDLVPIAKLKDFLTWREKEFVEKYGHIRHNSENDNYASMEAELEGGIPLLAIVNTSLLEWDGKASHPWILKVMVSFDGKDNDGFPDKETYAMIQELEDELTAQLNETDGYLFIATETADNTREICYACHEFRKPSKTAHALIQKYAGKLDLDYEMYKDKYWQSFEKYRQ